MNNVKVTKTSVPPARTSEGAFLQPFFTRMFPFDETGLFGLNPFSLMKEFPLGTNGETFLPAMECSMKDGKTIFTAELPGLKPEDVKVEVTGDTITIEGEKKAETKEEKEGYLRTERRYGKFYRTLPLPEGAKLEEVKAEIANGILTVTIPGAPPAPPPAVRQIPVQATK